MESWVFLILISFLIIFSVVLFFKKKKVTLLRLFFSWLAFIFFLFLIYFPLEYFYVFFFKNKKNFLKIAQVKKVESTENYLEVGQASNGEEGGFYFDQENAQVYFKNLLTKERKSLDAFERKLFFLDSSPFIDLPLKNQKFFLEPVFQEKGKEVISQLKVKQGNAFYFIPRDGSYHSYSIAPQGIFFSQQSTSSPFLDLYFTDLQKNQKISFHLPGHNYYPYFWGEKGLLYFLVVNQDQVEKKKVFVFNVAHYHPQSGKVIASTLLGGDENLNLRPIKFSGNETQEYLAYSSLNKENKVNFFYYFANAPIDEPLHFYLEFGKLKKIYSLAFLKGKREPYSLLLLAQDRQSSNRSIFKVKLEKEKIPTLKVGFIFYVYFLLWLAGIAALVLSLVNLRVKR